MADGLRFPELCVPAVGRQPALIEAGRIGERQTAEIGYWIAVAARGRGIAPAAVRAVTDWVFEAFAGAGLRQVMLVHDVDNPASCRVAEKAGYPFLELSPANPPHWLTDGHIHMRQISLI
jgi:RimJ/RimL family protein N-acetyltransferase